MEHKCLEVDFECYEIACFHVEMFGLIVIFGYECMVKNT
jgi:hypothetical protein